MKIGSGIMKESRVEKYYYQDLESYERVKRNQDLYKDLSKEISDLDNLPIPDNSNEIDLDGLKKIIYSRDEYRKEKERKEKPQYETLKEEEPNDKRIYDINVLLENAKSELNKNNEIAPDKKIKTNFLTDLEEEKIPYHEDAIEISNMESVKKSSDEDSLPLDLLVDLKGEDNTVVTDPIIKDEVTMIKKIKDGETFYSGSFNFTKKDFEENDEDDNLFDESSHNGIKIVFLIFGLLLIGAAIFFIMTKYIL